MIIAGWISWAVRIDGVPDKIYSQANTGEWITCHSIVGQETEFQDGIPNRFLDTSKDESGNYTPYAAASCMFILRTNGTLIQMYPVTASTWTSGGREANTRSWAVEAEGGLSPNYGEPLTPMQEQTFIRLVREWEQYTGFPAIPGITLRQHKDVAIEFNYPRTACASDRYNNAWLAIEQGDTMTEDQVRAIVREEFDTGLSSIFRNLIKAYFVPSSPGGYSDSQGNPIPPDLEVMNTLRSNIR